MTSLGATISKLIAPLTGILGAGAVALGVGADVLTLGASAGIATLVGTGFVAVALVDLILQVGEKNRLRRIEELVGALGAERAADLAAMGEALWEAGVDAKLVSETGKGSPLYALMVLIRNEQENRTGQLLEELRTSNEGALAGMVSAIESRFTELREVVGMTWEELRDIRGEVSGIQRRLAEMHSTVEQVGEDVRPHPRLKLEWWDANEELSNPFRAEARRVPLFGRKAEMDALLAFVDDPEEEVRWWLIHGQAGFGKTRLAHELCLLARASGWEAGFLDGKEKFEKWSGVRLVKPTLIVIDYAGSRANEAARAIAELRQRKRDLGSGMPKVRVLLLERMNEGRWRDDFEAAGQNALPATRYADDRGLGRLSDAAVWSIMEAVFQRRGMGKQLNRVRCLASLGRIDGARRPLYAAIVAEAIVARGEAEVAGWSREDLLDHVFAIELKRWREQGVPHEYTNALVLATMIGGLELKVRGNASPIEEAIGKGLLPEARKVDASQWQRLAAFTGGKTGSELGMPALEPDILGEHFVLRRLGGKLHVDGRADGVVAEETRELVDCAWGMSGGVKDAPAKAGAFIVRAALSFPESDAMRGLLEQVPSGANGRYWWAALQADIVGGVYGELGMLEAAQKRFDQLEAVTKEYGEEQPEIRVALAKGAYNLVTDWGLKGECERAQGVFEKLETLAS